MWRTGLGADLGAMITVMVEGFRGLLRGREGRMNAQSEGALGSGERPWLLRRGEAICCLLQEATRQLEPLASAAMFDFQTMTAFLFIDNYDYYFE